MKIHEPYKMLLQTYQCVRCSIAESFENLLPNVYTAVAGILVLRATFYRAKNLFCCSDYSLSIAHGREFGKKAEFDWCKIERKRARTVYEFPDKSGGPWPKRSAGVPSKQMRRDRSGGRLGRGFEGDSDHKRIGDLDHGSSCISEPVHGVRN